MSLKIVNIVRNHWSRHNVIVPFGSVTTIHACSTGSDQAPTVSTPPKQKLLKRSGRRQLKELKQAVQDVIPYPEVKIRARPEDRAVVLFGGESSEYVGMVEDTLDLPQVRQLYETAEKKFNIDFIDISLNGPVERLHDLEYNHLTIFLANAAALEKLKMRIPNIEQITRATAGYGVGEINSLVYSQMITFEEALDYLHLRSILLKKTAQALEPTKSYLINYTAASKLGFMCRAAKEWCVRQGVPEQQAICQITHKLGPQRCIIGGHAEAFKFILLNRKEFALHSVKDAHFPLALYSQCVKPVGDMLREALPELSTGHPRYQTVSAIDGVFYNRMSLRKKMIEQIHRQVNMEGALSRIYQRNEGVAFPQTYECAAQAHVKKLLFRCNRKATQNSKRVLAC